MAAKKAKQPKPPAPAAMGKATAAKGQSARAQKAVSARMEKQAERGVGIPAKESERAAVIKKADKVFGKGNYNLVSGAKTKVPVYDKQTGNKSYALTGSGKLTAVSKGVGSASKANTKITASNVPSARIYNPWKTETMTNVTRKKNKPSSQIKKK
jgi:hypothetical protein